MRLNAKFTGFCLVLALAPVAIAQQERGSGHEGHGGMSGIGAQEEPADGATAWAELKETRDAIAKLIERSRLADVHNQAERLAPLGLALSDGAKSLPQEKRKRIEATLRQLPELGKTLDKAGDAGDAEATRRELKRLDGVIALIQAQYPADVLSKVPAPGGATRKPEPSERGPAGDEHGGHMHSAQPLAEVDVAPKATLRVQSGEFKFEPKSITMKAGEPTRLELENEGAIEHALIVAAPDGKGDWIHLHALANATDSGTFQIDQPGTYRVLCTVPGHTEAGMVGELVVR